MVAHAHFHIMNAHFSVGHYPQWHALGIGILTRGVCHIALHVIREMIEECPYASLAIAATTKVGGCIGIAETEIFILAIKPSHLARILNHIL